MRGMRQQYAGEGYIVSVLTTAFGCIILAMAKAETIFKKPVHKRIGVALLILAAFGLLQAYLMCYRIKNPWYNVSFFPPRHYTKGPIQRDQGNVI